jgi:D-arabinono-1,4-lactone oxidase
MPCLAESVASTAGEQLADLLFAHLFTAGVYYRPTNKPELVTAVAQSTDSGHSLRALGSNWCISSAGVADDIVDTTALGLHLSQPYHQGSGPAGQEWWITPTTTSFGNGVMLSTLTDWCPDTQIVADDETFDAVRVGVGRMGVVYAVIVEVVAAYALLEVNLEHRWSDIRAQLPGTGIVGGVPSGIFNQPIADLDNDWFRGEVLKRTRYQTPKATGNPGFAYVATDTELSDVPAYFQQHPEVYPQVTADLGLIGLADELRGGPTMALRHMNLAISLSTTDRCWIRRRWSCPTLIKPVNLEPGEDDPIVSTIKANKTNPSAIVGPIKDQIDVDFLTNFLGWLVSDARWERLQWYLNSELQHVADQTAAIGATSFEALVQMMFELGTDQVLQQGTLVASKASDIIAGSFSELVRAGPASGGLNENMLDRHDYGLDGAEAGDSAEFHFDASTGTYLEFIDAVVNLAGVHFPVFGYIGIRFTPRSTALIAMQQFDLTASVEISTAKTRVADLFGAFWNDVHATAAARCGIAHWGQEFRQSAEYLQARYGDHLNSWRRVLGSLSNANPTVFSTPFSRDKGLEPDWSGVDEDDDAIEMFLLALAGGSDR